MVKLKAFSKFENTAEALAAATALVDSKLSKGLKKFLKKNAADDELAVLDAKLGGIIKEKLGIQCLWRCEHHQVPKQLELGRGLPHTVYGKATLEVSIFRAFLRSSVESLLRDQIRALHSAGMHLQAVLTGSRVKSRPSLSMTLTRHPPFTPLPCACCSNGIMELARGIRAQLQALISGLAGADLTPMSLGLSHSLSRYKLKFSPDKVRSVRISALGSGFKKEGVLLAAWHVWYTQGSMIQLSLLFVRCHVHTPLRAGIVAARCPGVCSSACILAPTLQS